jgi:hydroxymethylpyrimidine/phosphomethylpyrimidine kinase
MTISHQNKSNIALTKKALLSIAGFDPTGGAGILIDAVVFRALDFHPLAVLTSVAAQGATGVRQVMSLPDSFIRNELDIIQTEFRPAAVKIGMLFSVEAVRIVSEFIREQDVPIVLDPLIAASSGGSLIDKKALSELENNLIPHCTIATPNIPEVSHFLKRDIPNLEEMETAAVDLSSKWGCAVLLKGGHLSTDSVDMMAVGGKCTRFPHTRVSFSGKIRGTGCVLSSALAGFLTKGYNLEKAVAAAIDFTVMRIQNLYSASKIADIEFLNPTSNP